jgi:hypothetical protein
MPRLGWAPWRKVQAILGGFRVRYTATAVVSVVASVALALTGCGSSSTPSSATTSAATSTRTDVPTSSSSTASPGQPATATAAPAGAAAELAGKDAAGVVAWLKAAGVTVKVTKVYDEDSDPNNMLGRPGGYTSKAAFQDQRVPASKYGSEVDDPNRGGSVEVFADQAAAVARARDVQTKLKAFGLGTEYDYVVGGVLVRVTGTVKPSQARGYEKALGVPAQPAA